MTSAEERKKEISDFVAGAIRDNAKIFLDGAPQFNGFGLNDQIAVLQIYEIKARNEELAVLIEDRSAAVEEVARLYDAQKRAFKEVLTDEGFQIISEVSQDYSGKIAWLTNHGTFTLLGKYKKSGRVITMSRIHSPHLDYDHKKGHLTRDLCVGLRARIVTTEDDSFKTSPVRALAINPDTSDDDEAGSAEDTVFGIGEKTAMILMRPRKVSEPAYQ